MSRPTFLVIGAFKCGTTSLQHYLVAHPEIQMPAMKETNFFSGPPNGVPYATGAKRIESLGEYERLFDPTVRARGEASPNYTAYPRRKGTAARIKDIVPGVKLVYLVRDPIARTVSHYHHRVSTEGERRSLRDALGRLDDPTSPYTCSSLYATQLEQYLQHFRQEQILVVDQADLLEARRDTLRQIFSFLSVDDSFSSPSFETTINTADERRTYSRFIIAVRLAQASPLRFLPRTARVGARRALERAVSRPLPAPALDEDLRCRLQELYAGDVARLRALTGKEYPTWCV
jgi:hypothetical protein